MPDGVFVQSIQTLFCAHYLQEPKILISPCNWQGGLKTSEVWKVQPGWGTRRLSSACQAQGMGILNPSNTTIGETSISLQVSTT